MKKQKQICIWFEENEHNEVEVRINNTDAKRDRATKTFVIDTFYINAEQLKVLKAMNICLVLKEKVRGGLK